MSAGVSQLRGAMQKARKDALTGVRPKSADMIPVHAIQLPTSQPRKFFDPHVLEELANSIRKQGVLQPILVRPLEGVGGKYELVAGERRLRAAQLLGLAELPAVVREMSEVQARENAIVENIQREDLNPLEETEGMLDLLGFRLGLAGDEVISLLHRMHNEEKGKTTQNVLGKESADTVVQTFESVGKISWTSFVVSRLPLLKLPQDVLLALRAGRLAYTKAKEVARIDDLDVRKQLLQEVIENNSSLAQIRAKVAALTPTKPKNTDSLDYRAGGLAKRLRKAKPSSDISERVSSLLDEIESLLAAT